MSCMHDAVAGMTGGREALQKALQLGGDRYRLFAVVARQLDPDGDQLDIEKRGYQLAMDYGRRCARAIAAAPERRGARSALAASKRRGLKLYINSATPRRDILGLLRARGIAGHLDGTLGAPTSKTDNLRRLMRSERLSARQVVVVGDSMDDLVSARTVGAWFVAVTVEPRIRERVAYGIKDLNLLLPLLDRLARRPLARVRQ
ncbi:HAD family hydrolase [Rhodoplanes sp. Z2-YC6860]|uniref:HAD family hydrolase n=1 Tax=Rhodoplanes sp. Z2-YC6860 TaxID=674703 RepID=UPI001F462B4E|nr:HAD family hydrolase [Rhodoplanes sp. Z2-YC6860]